MNDQIIELVSDPINGPFYGEDFCIDDDGFIQTDSIKHAALIMRKVNQSQIFDQKLVKLGQAGGTILLGFDTLFNSVPVYTAEVGPDKNPVEVKKDESGKFCLYVSNKRSSRMFNKLAAVKKYIKQLDSELKQVAEFEEVEED